MCKKIILKYTNKNYYYYTVLLYLLSLLSLLLYYFIYLCTHTYIITPCAVKVLLVHIRICLFACVAAQGGEIVAGMGRGARRGGIGSACSGPIL